MRTSEFTYSLPDEVVAQHPIEPRHAARLLDTRNWSDRTFLDMPDLLSPGDLVVVNETRVRAARLWGRKADTGGSVQTLLLRRIDANRWEALVKPSRRLRTGTLLQLGGLVGEVLEGPCDGVVVLRLTAVDGQDVEEVIARHGQMPLPPYIKGGLADPERYQTVFARSLGSAAAPTAGLHFTEAVLTGLQQRGVGVVPVQLEIGLDTFRPIATEHLVDHRMHTERYLVPPETAERIATTRRAAGRVVAIGTTVVRALESAAGNEGEVAPGPASTDLFITPGYRFAVVDALVTNFHLPGSTLVVLVAAFMGAEWRRAYAHALARGYRFLSFGDAMYVERSE